MNDLFESVVTYNNPLFVPDFNKKAETRFSLNSLFETSSKSLMVCKLFPDKLCEILRGLENSLLVNIFADNH